MNRNIFDPEPLRAHFPSLALKFGEYPAVFFDNPGGTQVPEQVIEAVSAYYRTSNANVGGAFATSRRTDEWMAKAREGMAALLNAPGPETIVFGANMTTLTFHIARSFADTIRPGDEIIVTNLDHDANVTPWLDLQANGAVIRTVDFHPEDGTLDWEGFRAALSDKTRLVAVAYASNAIGTVLAIESIVRQAHEAGALVYVDAVQYVPHGPVDVQALDCDFLACSAYKFFGPHVGVLYGKADLLARLTPHKVRPAKDTSPFRWETGTQNHEGLAGVVGALAYLEEVGERFGADWEAEYRSQGYPQQRLRLKTAMRAICEYEKTLSARLLEGLRQLPDIKVYGLTDPDRLDERLPTVAFTWPRRSPRATAEYLASHGICCWSGNYYALRLMERLGLENEGGAVRIGPAHYNTNAEIDFLLEILHAA